jgi:beta-lactamase regulating signal transducer with metallopeptidase domain
MTESIIYADLMQRLAGSLLHFIWQAALIAMFAAMVLRLCAYRSAESRYAVGIGGLFLMLASPVITFTFYPEVGKITRTVLQQIDNKASMSLQSAVQTATTATWTQWIVLVWSAGVLFCSVRLIVGWRISMALTRIGTSSAPLHLQQAFDEIKARLAMTRPVRLLVSVRIDAPVAIGWLRPAVLLPVTALTGLSEGQLCAVLSHELAHIRRHDFLVNLVQCGVESILFYHPAVWWISARIRTEREHCCDDLAVQVSGDSSIYAEALMELERFRVPDTDPAVAATGGNLTRRIHRLLGYKIVNSDLQSAIAALSFVVIWVVVGAWQSDRSLHAHPITITTAEAQLAAVPVEKLPPAVSAATAIAAIVSAQPVQPVQAPALEYAESGAIEGVLQDGSGLRRGGIVVVATGVREEGAASSEFVRHVTTDGRGRYRLERLPAGRYQVSAGRAGFPTYYLGTLNPDRSSIVTVVPGKTANISFVLDPFSNRWSPTPDDLVDSFKATGIFSAAARAAGGILNLFVSVQIEGGGRIPVLTPAGVPRLRLTKLNTNVNYEMPLSSIMSAVPLDLDPQAAPEDYKVSVEDLPSGYVVKNIMYRADEPGFRLIDVTKQPLRISIRAAYEAHAGSNQRWGAPDIPIAITLTRTPAPALPGIRVAGSTGGVFARPKLPRLGENVPSSLDLDLGIYISGKPGTLYDDGTFEFYGVAPGLHTIVLFSGSEFAAAKVVVRDRNVDGVSLERVSLVPKDISSPQALPANVGDVSVLPLSSLTVRVLDGSTQQPINSGYVTLSGVGSSSDRLYVGRSFPTVQVLSLLPGQYLVTAESAGYKTKTQPVIVGLEETKFDIMIGQNP